MTIVSASILGGAFWNLAEELSKLEKAGVDRVHIDVMDGNFVPNLTFGPDLVKAAKKLTKLPLDVHLMICNAEQSFEQYIEAGADYLTVSFEAVDHPHRILQEIRNKGVKSGVALNPGTSIVHVEDLLDVTDLVLIMSVNPGFCGQKFIPNSVQKISKLKSLVNQRKIEISVDGGIDESTSQDVRNAGAQSLVSGSYLFKSPNMAEAVKKLKDTKK